ncbi:hypothetical protein [Enterococcus termitis]|jgi:hypothetical protein|uniref:Uncharacterized protein n=1 Tax=Enterococcus termitis TaxID=332950 RepID=A0A1E5GZH2_9ENTE|nr:hypothetical protein [Enterococcus termitis]OEG17730.1 hypothetical protein BCR25_17805 [Enterococcus termitis]OJG96873.1 hypothetical protein RV18_GL001811 [Enterococcus termitis]
MSKKIYVVIEIVKIFVLSWFVGLVYNASISNDYADSEMKVIGYTFLIMLGTLIVSSIALEILVSIFMPKENRVMGEWEKLVDKNILRNFAYMLSAFFVIVMASFAFQASLGQVVLLFRIGFFVLIATTNLTKAYYYVG